MPTAQPMSSADRWNHLVYSPTTIAGIVCRIQTPPSSWRLMAYCLENASTKTSAPNFTTSEASLLCLASWASVASRLMNAL